MPPETDRTNGWLGRRSKYFHPSRSPFALSFRQASSADFNRLTRCRQTLSQIATALLPCGGSRRSRLFILETTCCNPCLVVGSGSDITRDAERDSGNGSVLRCCPSRGGMPRGRGWPVRCHIVVWPVDPGGAPSLFVSTTVYVLRWNAARIRAWFKTRCIWVSDAADGPHGPDRHSTTTRLEPVPESRSWNVRTTWLSRSTAMASNLKTEG